MNKEIENQIASVIESALNLGGESKVFLYEQIPDLVNQLLMWNIINGIITTVICLIIGIIIFKFFNSVEKSDYDSVDKFFMKLFSITIIGAIVAIGFSGATKSLKSVVAPKVVILETVSKILRK